MRKVVKPVAANRKVLARKVLYVVSPNAVSPNIESPNVVSPKIESPDIESPNKKVLPLESPKSPHYFRPILT